MRGYVCVFFFYIVGCIGGDYVECIGRDDFCGVSQVHCLSESYGDAQACEASGPDGYMYLLDLVRLFAETVQDVADGGKNLGAVPDGCGKSGFGENFFAEGYYNRAYSAGCFNS